MRVTDQSYEKNLQLRTRLKGLLKAAQAMLLLQAVDRQDPERITAVGDLQKQVWKARKELGLK